MCIHHPLNELNIHFPLDHWWFPLENFPNAGFIVPVSTIGKALEWPTAFLGQKHRFNSSHSDVRETSLHISMALGQHECRLSILTCISDPLNYFVFLTCWPNNLFTESIFFLISGKLICICKWFAWSHYNDIRKTLTIFKCH